MLLWAMTLGCSRDLPILQARVTPATLVADGYGVATVSGAGAAVRVVVLENARAVTVSGAQVRAGVMPGRVVLRVSADGYRPADLALTLTADGADHLNLEDDADQSAFRRWFTFLAEAEFFQPLPHRAKINDCAALIRYAYREALRRHDGQWAAAAKLPLVPGIESVAKYSYPYTPLGANLFRVSESGVAQFADAQTLWRWNTHFVSRDVRRALPGDVLFFRREGERAAFHSMIWLGRSQIEKNVADYMLYHTGPDGREPGEIRRPSVQELLRHPDEQWRPVTENERFLGVYRWNILRRDSE